MIKIKALIIFAAYMAILIGMWGYLMHKELRDYSQQVKIQIELLQQIDQSIWQTKQELSNQISCEKDEMDCAEYLEFKKEIEE